MKKGSRVIFVCPISGARRTQPYSEEPDGVFHVHDTDDPPTVPLRWGRIVIEKLVPNPEIREVAEARKEFVANAMETAREMSEKDDDQGRQVKSELESGRALHDVMMLAEREFPDADEEPVVMRAEYSTLAPEALDGVVEALQPLGYVFRDEEEE